MLPLFVFTLYLRVLHFGGVDVAVAVVRVRVVGTIVIGCAVDAGVACGVPTVVDVVCVVVVVVDVGVNMRVSADDADVVVAVDIYAVGVPADVVGGCGYDVACVVPDDCVAVVVEVVLVTVVYCWRRCCC